MSDAFSISTFFALLACLLMGLGFSWLLYSRTAHLDRRLRIALAILRTLIVSAIGFLLFFPLVRRVSYVLEKPLIVIAQDNSISAAAVTGKGFDAAQYQKDLRQLAAELARSYEVKVYHFSDSAGGGFDFKGRGKLTDASRLINQLNDQLLNRNVGAVIFASDGIFNRGGSPLYEVNKLKAPFYTIALGDTVPKKDLLIANINYHNLVYLDNDFTVEVQVQAFESKGERTRLSILDNGKVVYEQQFNIGSNAFIQNIPVKLKASAMGLQRYTVQLSPIGDETVINNNRQQIVVEVIDTRQKILIAAAGPHPDIAALKDAITRNKHYELKVAFGDDLNGLNINDYSLVVLYQLPAALQTEGNAFMTRLKQSTVAIWYILGAQSNLYAFNQFQELVNYSGNTNIVQESFAVADPGFTLFDLNDPASVKAIEGFDPLQTPFGKPAVTGSAAVALGQRIGKIKTGSPLLFFVNNGGRKSGYLMGEGVWKWRLAESQLEQQTGAFSGLVSNTVQYLAVKDDKRKFKVYTTKNTFDEQENVLINATLYNDSYQPFNKPDVSIEIRNGSGKSYNFLFSRAGNAYQLDAGTLPQGSYSYQASVLLGGQKHTAKGMFYVTELMAEYQQTTANHQLLNAMSRQTNGKMHMPGQLLDILKDISGNEQVKTLSYEDRKYEELINFKWLFALLMTMLSVEWFFRKRNGEI